MIEYNRNLNEGIRDNVILWNAYGTVEMETGTRKNDENRCNFYLSITTPLPVDWLIRLLILQGTDFTAHKPHPFDTCACA